MNSAPIGWEGLGFEISAILLTIVLKIKAIDYCNLSFDHITLQVIVEYCL